MARRRGKTFPIEWHAALMLVIVWNVLYIFGLPLQPTENFQLIHTGAFRSLLFLLFMSIAILWIPPVTNFFLKEDRSVKEIRHMLFFLIFLSSVMLLFLIINTRHF